jgi:hypothetical protein
MDGKKDNYVEKEITDKKQIRPLIILADEGCGSEVLNISRSNPFSS